LSPGGLLLPYHVGALHCLTQNHVIVQDDSDCSSSSFVAGSSAGSIAAMAYGCNISPYDVLEGTIAISDQCAVLGQARGNLARLLNEQMERFVGEEQFDFIRQSQQQQSSSSSSNIGIAYHQVFPTQESFLQTRFDSREDLLKAVRFSCAFPFFTSNWPWVVDTTTGTTRSSSLSSTSPARLRPRLPRLMVDGYFSVPRQQFGCPILHRTNNVNDDEDEKTNTNTAGGGGNTIVVDRTVSICCLPKDIVGLTAFDDIDCISPPITSDHSSNNDTTIHRQSRSPSLFTSKDLFRIATQPSSRKELTDLYELGYQNAETWCVHETKRQREQHYIEQEEQRRKLT
jgi:hypothetical protein